MNINTIIESKLENTKKELSELFLNSYNNEDDKDNLSVIINPIKKGIQFGDLLVKIKNKKKEYIIFLINPIKYSLEAIKKFSSIIDKYHFIIDENITPILLPVTEINNDNIKLIKNFLPTMLLYNRKEINKISVKNLILSEVTEMDNKIEQFISDNKDFTYDENWSRLFIEKDKLTDQLIAVVTIKRPKLHLKNSFYKKNSSWIITNIIKKDKISLYGGIFWLISRLKQLLLSNSNLNNSKLFSKLYVYKYGNNQILNDKTLKQVSDIIVEDFQCPYLLENIKNKKNIDINKYSSIPFPSYKILEYINH